MEFLEGWAFAIFTIGIWEGSKYLYRKFVSKQKGVEDGQ